MGAQKNCLIETVLLSTHNARFRWEIRKIIFNYALISGGLAFFGPPQKLGQWLKVIHNMYGGNKLFANVFCVGDAWLWLITSPWRADLIKCNACYICQTISGFTTKHHTKWSFNSFPAGAYLHRLQVTVTNSLDPDQAQRHVGPGLDPNCLTLWWYSWKNFSKKLILKIISRRRKHAKLPSMQELESTERASRRKL